MEIALEILRITINGDPEAFSLQRRSRTYILATEEALDCVYWSYLLFSTR